MPDEIKAEITFTDGTKIESRTTVENVMNSIGASTNPHIPIAKIEDADGNAVWINADHVRLIERYEPPRGP